MPWAFSSTAATGQWFNLYDRRSSSGLYRRCFGFLRAPFVLVERLHVQCRQPPKLCPILGGVDTSCEPLALPIRHLAAPVLLLRAHGFGAPKREGEYEDIVYATAMAL